MDLRYERFNNIHAGDRRMNHIVIAKSKFEFNFFNTGSICPSILYIKCFRTRTLGNKVVLILQGDINHTFLTGFQTMKYLCSNIH